MHNKYTLLFIISLNLLILISCGTQSSPSYALDIYVIGEGTITPSSGVFEEGETVIITATSAEKWIFDRWEGDVSSVENPLVITMNSDRTVIAVFKYSPVI